MNNIEIDYKTLSGTALIAIFTLADKRNITPREAAQMILTVASANELKKGVA